MRESSPTAEVSCQFSLEPVVIPLNVSVVQVSGNGDYSKIMAVGSELGEYAQGRLTYV